MRLEQEVNVFAKDAIKRRFLAAETSVSVMQGKISALISESEIQELQNSGTTMYSKLGKLDMSVSGLTQRIPKWQQNMTLLQNSIQHLTVN